MGLGRWMGALALSAMLVVCAVGMAGAAEMSPALQKLYDAARKEGELTWYVSQHDSEFAEKIAAQFSTLYPGIKVNVVRVTGQVQFQRVTQELKSGVGQDDVYATNDESQIVALIKDDAIAEYHPENLAKLLPSLRTMGDTAHYWPTSLSPVAIGYNTNLVKAEDAPKTWTDLADPKWKDQVAIGHPGFSGSVGIWCIAMVNLYGWDYFKALAKNNPQIGRSIVDGYNLILSGERKVALVPTALTEDGKAKGQPIETVYPDDGTLLFSSPSAILKSAPHPNAARLFIEYQLGVDYSNLLSGAQRLPLRPDAAPLKGVKPMSELKVITVPVEDATGKLEDTKDKFRDIFGV